MPLFLSFAVCSASDPELSPAGVGRPKCKHLGIENEDLVSSSVLAAFCLEALQSGRRRAKQGRYDHVKLVWGF